MPILQFSLELNVHLYRFMVFNCMNWLENRCYGQYISNKVPDKSFSFDTFPPFSGVAS